MENNAGLARINSKIIVHESFIQNVQNRLMELLKEYHAKNPLQAGMRRDELRGRLFPRNDSTVADSVLELFAKRNIIRLDTQESGTF